VIKAILFDVDGTLYLQARLRALMAGELVSVPWLQHAPWRVSRVWTALRTFRHVREELRRLGQPPGSLERLQYTEAAARAGLPVGEIEECVEEWIVRRPLKYLPHVVRPGTLETMARLRDSGRRIGVFSDYPAAAKLKAMRIDHLVSLIVEATEADVNAFKPHPRGFLVAAERWGIAPREILYVGDRPDVDAVGAEAAGMHCVVVGRTGSRGQQERYLAATSMTDLDSLIERDWSAGS